MLTLEQFADRVTERVMRLKDRPLCGREYRVPVLFFDRRGHGKAGYVSIPWSTIQNGLGAVHAAVLSQLRELGVRDG